MKRNIFSLFTVAALLLLVSFKSWSQPDCNIRIFASSSPANPLLVSFRAIPVDSNSTCFGPNSVFTWNLGDGANITGQSPTYSYNQSGTYLVCVTATTTFGFTVTACDTITVGQTANCQLNFDFQVALPAIPLTFQFTPSSSPNCFTSYRWTWGDGTTSNTNNPTPVIKTFPSPGTYTVCLTGFRQPGIAPVEVCKTVVVANPNPSVGISGMVLADGNCFNGPIVVELMALNGPELFIDSLNGWADSCFYYFSIPQTPLRVWTVRATAVNRQDYVGTYLGDVLFFDEATLFTTPAQSQHLPPINLLGNYYDSLIAGNPNPQGIITGQVNGSGTIVTTTVQGHNLSTTFQAGAARIIVLDANGNAVATATVRPDGSYALPALPEGSYQIRVDHPGVPSQPLPIQVTASGAVVNFNASNTGINVVTGNRSKMVTTNVSVYPNPASQHITLSGFSGKISMLDMTGKVLQTFEAESPINIESLPAGVFTLKGFSENGLPVTTRFMKK